MLVVTQVSRSLMLLTASFLMVRVFQNTLLEGTGFAKDHLLMTGFDPRLVQYNAAQTQQFYELLAERVRQAPGVQSEALTQNIPLGTDDFDGIAFVPEGLQMPRNRKNFNSTMDTVDEGYFETMGIPILRGRSFLASDTADAPRVAVVNEQFAKHYWPGGDAVGKRIRLESRAGTLVEIVGVAQTIKYQGSIEKPMDFVYMPLAQHPVPRMVLMLRSSGDPLQLIQPVKDVVRTLDPNLPMLHTMRSEEHTSELQSRQYLVCRLLLEKKKKNKHVPEREREHDCVRQRVRGQNQSSHGPGDRDQHEINYHHNAVEELVVSSSRAPSLVR